MKCKKCKTTGLETDIYGDCFEEQTFKEVRKGMKTEEEKSYYSGFTEDKPDLNQDIFNYIHNLTGSTLLFDEISGLISIFEKHGWDKKVWQKEKPDYPCLFLTRSKYGSETYCNSYTITEQEGYLAIVDGNGGEWGALEDLQADEYFVIERF